MTASDWSTARGQKWRSNLAGMEAMIALVDEPLIAALRLDTPCRIADIGCGGGGTAREILRGAPRGSVVHGFDISPDLIELARSREQADASSLAFKVADAATAIAPDPFYDRLVSRFGIMFFDDPPAAFANLVRWLAPGGRFAFATWGPLAENPWMTSIRQVVAEIVDLPKPDPEAPGPFRYADSDKLVALLDAAGFDELNVSDWRGALPIGGGLSAGNAANFALAAFSIFGELLAQAGDATLENARQLLATRFSEHLQNGVVRLDACVHIVSGRLR